MTGLVRVEAEGHLGALTLTDPDRLNALSAEMLEEIRAAASWLDAQPGVSVVIVSGAGRAFSAGFDLPSLAAFDQLDSDAQRDAALLGGLVADAVEAMRAVTVAQLHGREFDASEAMSNGFVNHVVPDGELASRVEAEADHLASMPQQALLATKRAMAEVGPEDDGNEALLEALRSDAFRVARDRYLGRQ
jgi:enoyl-CoA hydratase/carnithine racemase